MCKLLDSIGYGNIAVSDVTCAELFYGARNKAEWRIIKTDLLRIAILHITEDISQMAAALVERYCLSHKLCIEDALIAATAIVHGMPLFTLNVKDFQFLPDIALYMP
jgi:predicted nucleic acid-binding protein